MSDAAVVHILVLVLKTCAFVLGPILGAVLLVSVVISLIQAATQVQEYTLTFVPKLLAVAFVLMVGGRWMLSQVEGLFVELLHMVPTLLGN